MQRLLLAAGVGCALGAALVWADEQKDGKKKAEDKKWVFVDLQPLANQKLKENFHYGARMPPTASPSCPRASRPWQA